MKLNTSNYELLGSNSVIYPHYVIEIEFSDTSSLWLTSHSVATALLPVGVLPADVIYGCIEGIGGQSQKVVPDKAQSTIGSVNFKLLDIGGALTDRLNSELTAGNGIRKKTIRLYKGWQDLADWDDYSLRLTYLVYDMSSKNDVYTIQAGDIQRITKTDIFDPHQGVLTSTISATAGTVPITIPNAASKFPLVEHDIHYSANPSTTIGYIIIDDEVIAHSGWDATNTFLIVVERGALGTREQSHTVTATETDKKKKVQEYIYLEMAAPRMIYSLLTGDIPNQTGGLPDHWQLGVDPTFVTLADFEALGVDLWDPSDDSGKLARFMGTQSQQGKKFIEEELLLWLGAFMPIYANGAFGCRRLRSVLPYSEYVALLNEIQIESYSDLRMDQKAVINNIAIKWNWIESLNRFTKTSILIDSNSIAKYGKADQKNYEFKGVFTGVHTDTDLNNYFNQIRDRYGSPPLRLKIKCAPRWDVLEVGDTIRVDLAQVKDIRVNGSISRVFEVQQVATDWITGKVTLDLFGGNEAASQNVISGSFVMADSYYTSEGTDISTFLTIVGGTITVDGTLAGGPFTRTVFYYDGDLTIGAGVTLDITGNVELRVKGGITINGAINGVGAGHPGGAGGFSGNHFGQDGIPGNLGYIGYSNGPFISGGDSAWLGGYAWPNQDNPPLSEQIPPNSLNIVNPDGLQLNGLIQDLSGSSGSGGDGVVFRTGINFQHSWGNNGGRGGDSGAGFQLVNRGIAFGPSGEINVSGDNGAPGLAVSSAGGTVYGGPGIPGAAGTVLVLIDGDSALPDSSKITALRGNLTIPSVSVRWDKNFTGGGFGSAPIRSGQSYSLVPNWGGDANPWNQQAEHVAVKYIPAALNGFVWLPPNEAEESVGDGYDDTRIPEDVINFQAHQNGDTVVFKWRRPLFDSAFEIRYSPIGVGSWEDATPLTVATKGTNITSADVTPGAWTFFVRAVSTIGIYSNNFSQVDLVVTTQHFVIEQATYAPDFVGIYTNLVLHYTGKLVPTSQSLASAFGDEMWDVAVPNPYPTSNYEALPEVDIGFDDTARIWGEITSGMLVGELGAADPGLSVDHKLEAASYDGFVPWSIGQAVLRQAKGRVDWINTNGIYYVDEFEFSVDQLEGIQRDLSVLVAPGGTLVTFPQAYHSIPFIKVFVESTGALLATYESLTTTTFIFHIWNTAGTDVGGAGSWEATGI